MQLSETQIFLSGLGDIKDHHVHVHHVHHVHEWERLCCLGGGKKKMELEKKECYLADGRTKKQSREDRATKSMDTEIEFRNFYQTHGSHGSDLWLSMSVSP